MAITTGTTFPTGVEFAYVPIDLSSVHSDNALACARPFPLKLDKLIEQNAGSNILLVSVPGAFSPTCTDNHIPPFLEKLQTLKEEKNISAFVVISANDPFTINAWSKLLLKEAKIDADADLPKVIFGSDPNVRFSLEHDIALDLSEHGMGLRTGRYAFVINAATRKVSYFGIETGPVVEASGYDAIISADI